MPQQNPDFHPGQSQAAGNSSPAAGVTDLAANPQWDRLLEELVKYYRLSAVGRRTIGIIHNINTPLQAILMQSELIQRKLAEEARFAARLPAELLADWQAFYDYRQQKNQQLQEEIGKIQRLVSWLRYQGLHENHRDPQEIDLNQLVRYELEGYLAEAFFKHRVAKKYLWEAELPPIRGSYIDFSQSFRNLVDNALEALQEVASPVLTVGTSMVEQRRVITVMDNGPGVPPEVQEKLFTPFVTTKTRGPQPHAGLGLFLAQRLLAPYGGTIQITSRPGETCCRIILP